MRMRMVVAGLALAAAAGCASKGYQKSEHVATRIHGTVAAMDAYGASRQASLDAMNGLLAEPPADLAQRFETFHRCVDRMVGADGHLRAALASMKSSGDKRFQSWGQENLQTSDPEMVLRSQKSRAEATVCFQKAVTDTDAMLVKSQSFVTYLTDLRNVLSNDLSTAGVASVGEFASKARIANGELDALARPTLVSLNEAATAMSSRAGTQ